MHIDQNICFRNGIVNKVIARFILFEAEEEGKSQLGLVAQLTIWSVEEILHNSLQTAVQDAWQPPVPHHPR